MSAVKRFEIGGKAALPLSLFCERSTGLILLGFVLVLLKDVDRLRDLGGERLGGLQEVEEFRVVHFQKHA